MQSSKKMNLKFNEFFQKFFVIISALFVLKAMTIFKINTCFEFVFFSKHKIKKNKENEESYTKNEKAVSRK